MPLTGKKKDNGCSHDFPATLKSNLYDRWWWCRGGNAAARLGGSGGNAAVLGSEFGKLTIFG